MGGIIVAIVLAIAVTAPPNNWDSQTYHLPRVEHWIQNRSVEHYPTHIIRQLYLNPFAEYVILQVRLLGDGDRYVALVQFAAMLGCLVGVSLVARLLGSRLNGQVFAPVLCVTLPMGILQASSTQNDYVTAFCLICMIVFLLQARTQPSLPMFGLAGLAVGLAILTKVVAALFAAPFLIWLAAIGIRRCRWHAWKPALLIVVLCVAADLPSQVRNYSTFGTLTKPDLDKNGKDYYGVEGITAGSVASNFLRNVALHLGSPDAPLNQSVNDAILAMHRWFGLDVNDPRTTFHDTSFRVPETNYNEDCSGNSLHFLLGIVALALILAWKPLRARRELLIYLLCLAAAFLIFCAYLRWQPWHVRLHLSLFVIGIPLIAVAMDRLNSILVGVPVVLSLLLLSYPWVTQNMTRPAIGPYSVFSFDRTRLLFIHQGYLIQPYSGLTQSMRECGCNELGLVFGPDDWEYPLWVLMRQHAGAEPRIDHVRVSNASGKLWDGRFSAGAHRAPPPALLVFSPKPAFFRFTNGRDWPPELADKAPGSPAMPSAGQP